MSFSSFSSSLPQEARSTTTSALSVGAAAILADFSAFFNTHQPHRNRRWDCDSSSTVMRAESMAGLFSTPPRFVGVTGAATLLTGGKPAQPPSKEEHPTPKKRRGLQRWRLKPSSSCIRPSLAAIQRLPANICGCGHSLDYRSITVSRRTSAGSSQVWCTFVARSASLSTGEACLRCTAKRHQVSMLSIYGLCSSMLRPQQNDQTIGKVSMPFPPSFSHSSIMASLSCASTQPCAHVSSFRDSSHSKSSSSHSPSTLESPSIYATFKVLQLVNAFRKKVTRKHTAQAKTKKVSSRDTITADDFCQDFERQAFEDIDRYLGRKTRNRRERKPRKVTEDTARPCCAVDFGDVPAEKSIERYVLQPALPDS